MQDDAAHAAEIKAKAKALQVAIDAARDAGLLVRLEWWDRHEPGCREPAPRLGVMVARPL